MPSFRGRQGLSLFLTIVAFVSSLSSCLRLSQMHASQAHFTWDLLPLASGDLLQGSHQCHPSKLSHGIFLILSHTEYVCVWRGRCLSLAIGTPSSPHFGHVPAYSHLLSFNDHKPTLEHFTPEVVKFQLQQYSLSLPALNCSLLVLL